MSGALGTLPTDRAGSGSGLLMTLRQVGGAIGLAVLAADGQFSGDAARAFAERGDHIGLIARGLEVTATAVRHLKRLLLFSTLVMNVVPTLPILPGGTFKARGAANAVWSRTPACCSRTRRSP